MKRNILQEKSYAFALKIIEVGYSLIEKKEYILSKQLIRSGTSIGANIEEGIGGHTEKDFHYKLNIAYKEARETKYWLRLLRDSKQLPDSKANDRIKEVEEILRILGSILMTMQNKKSAK
ncbi:MAG: four helix bundle protein [Cryomorphaceae bacterium]|jgi:four helix bundle protein